MEAESCVICAEALDVIGLGPCNHRATCGTCALRLRVLGDSLSCCLCKQQQETIVFTRSRVKQYDDFEIWGGRFSSMKYDEEAAAFFDEDCSDFMEMSQSLRGSDCAVCSAKLPTRSELISHLKDAHAIEFCSLCLRGRQSFLQEQPLFTQKSLKQHCATLHVACELCKRCHYDETELWAHMWKDHHACHLCPVQGVTAMEFFSRPEDVQAHHRSAHFLCEQPSCAAAFGSVVALAAHTASAHASEAPRAGRGLTFPLHAPASQPPRRNQPAAPRSVKMQLPQTVANVPRVVDSNDSMHWPTISGSNSVPLNERQSDRVRRTSARENSHPATLSQLLGAVASLNVTDSDAFPSLGGKSGAGANAVAPKQWGAPSMFSGLGAAPVKRKTRRGVSVVVSKWGG
mmetsp:Transcript_21380/g.50247  ORF Transcript_21380/g.50247 Transcript_21380/m.50247 type:complete len:401 (-) Transcript_21380:14-1216(-)